MNQYQTFHNFPQVLELFLYFFPCFWHPNNTSFLLRIQLRANGKSPSWVALESIPSSQCLLAAAAFCVSGCSVVLLALIQVIRPSLLLELSLKWQPPGIMLLPNSDQGSEKHIFICLKNLIFNSSFKYRFLLWSRSCCLILSRQNAMTELQLKFIFLHSVFPLNNPEIITLCMHILQFIWGIQNGITNIQGHNLLSLQ